MTQTEALTPFEALEVFKGYTEDQRITFLQDLFNIDQNPVTDNQFIADDDMNETLEILAHLRWYKDFIEHCYNYGKQFVINYVEDQKGVKVFDGKFSVANKKIYDYSKISHWLATKNDIKEIAEYLKQLEKVCQTGGVFDGKQIQKLEYKPEKELRFSIEK